MTVRSSALFRPPEPPYQKSRDSVLQNLASSSFPENFLFITGMFKAFLAE